MLMMVFESPQRYSSLTFIILLYDFSFKGTVVFFVKERERKTKKKKGVEPGPIWNLFHLEFVQINKLIKKSTWCFSVLLLQCYPSDSLGGIILEFNVCYCILNLLRHLNLALISNAMNGSNVIGNHINKLIYQYLK